MTQSKIQVVGAALSMAEKITAFFKQTTSTGAIAPSESTDRLPSSGRKRQRTVTTNKDGSSFQEPAFEATTSCKVPTTSRSSTQRVSHSERAKVKKQPSRAHEETSGSVEDSATSFSSSSASSSSWASYERETLKAADVNVLAKKLKSSSSKSRAWRRGPGRAAVGKKSRADSGRTRKPTSSEG